MNQNSSDASLKQLVLEIITKENGRPIPVGIIIKKIEQHQELPPNGVKDIFRVISDLVKDGTIKQLQSKKLVIGRTNTPIKENCKLIGMLSINLGGNGFITLENEKKASYYVHKTNLNGALDKNKVEFAPFDKPPLKNLIDATILKVIEHGKDFYTGVYLTEGDNDYKIKIDDEKFYLDVKLDSTQGLVNGQKLLIKIKEYADKVAYGSVSRIIGHTSDVGVDILSIVYDNGVEPDFPPAVLDYAQKITSNIDDEQRRIRRDLTNLPIVTIDPATSKDFDDAIYVKQLEDGKYFLSVSIADVSHYVKFKSVLDEEAVKRGCSIYLVDRVIPMLPHNLSDDICSLNPNVERLTLTCDTVIRTDGQIEDIKVYPSIIKSHRRFSYDEVNAFFNEKDDLSKDTNEVRQMLSDALSLHHLLDKTKKTRGYIDFEIPEPIIVVNDKGVPTEIKRYMSGTAQKMIEDFMVIANEAVTKYAEKQKWAFVYRVHDKPNADRLKMFALEAKKLGFKINTDVKNIQSKDISRWITDNKGNPNLDLISMMLLRSMAKAEYETKNIGHFGLALKDYTHFTSPIRRYPDLMVHRIFWMCDFMKEQTNEGVRKEMLSLLDEQASLSSKNELRSIKCERDVDAMKFAEYMQQHIGEEFDGFVSNVSPFGLFVQLPNTIEGLIKLVNLKNDFYSYNEKTNELTGRRMGLRFSLGTKVRIKVITANKETRKIEFELVKHLGNR